MQRLRRIMEGAFGKTELVAMPEGQVTLKNAPALKFSPANVPIPAPGDASLPYPISPGVPVKMSPNR